MTTLYLDCFSGVAGDMLVGALLDAGASFDALREGLASLGLSGFSVTAGPVDRGAIRATKFDVELDEGADRHPHRGLREIREILGAGDLPPRVHDRALAAFTLLARAEGRVHGKSADEVHFHEVGALDAICDVVGTALALEDLGVDRIHVGPIRAGSGLVACEHGSMPVPAPGTLACLAGFDVRFEQGRTELVTPTGACLVASLAPGSGAPESFVVERVGYGAGTRNPKDLPNVLRAVLGRVPDGSDADPVVELSTNLDHLPPTVLAASVDALFEAGALDAFVVPCTMKKGRAGHLVVALAPASLSAAVESALFRETGTLGVRRTRVDRTILERRWETVETPWGEVRVKLGAHRGIRTSVVPEFEDCHALALRHGVPVAEVIATVSASADRLRGVPSQGD